jgi:hypothetical protein
MLRLAIMPNVTTMIKVIGIDEEALRLYSEVEKFFVFAWSPYLARS